MNTNTFIMLFAIYSIATGLVVETIKNYLMKQIENMLPIYLLLLLQLLSEL